MSNAIEVTEISDFSELTTDQLKELANDAISDHWSMNLIQGIIDVLENERTKTERLEEMTIIDPLTGLRNRRRFGEYLTKFASRNEKSWVAILAFDIDHFKDVNDKHGHTEGDKVLVAVANILSDNFRPDDLVCRFGGDEFIVVVTGAVSKGFHGNADESRHDFEKMVSTAAGRVLKAVVDGAGVSISVGFDIKKAKYLAALKPLAITEAADAALYRAKAEGKNRVVMGVVGPT